MNAQQRRQMRRAGARLAQYHNQVMAEYDEALANQVASERRINEQNLEGYRLLNGQLEGSILRLEGDLHRLMRALAAMTEPPGGQLCGLHPGPERDELQSVYDDIAINLGAKL